MSIGVRDPALLTSLIDYTHLYTSVPTCTIYTHLYSWVPICNHLYRLHHLYVPVPTFTLVASLQACTHPYLPVPTCTIYTHRYPPVPFVLTFTCLFPPVPTYVHLYQPLPTSGHLYLPVINCSYLCPPMPTCNNWYHLYSSIPKSDNIICKGPFQQSLLMAPVLTCHLYPPISFHFHFHFTLLSLKRICILQLMITSKIYGMVSTKCK